MVNIPSKPSELSLKKMRGAGFSGKRAKLGGFSRRKKSGVMGSLWKKTTRSSAWGGTTRKIKYKNISNKDLKTMSRLIYDAMKKNERPGITKYQKQKILRTARTKMSREDLKDFRKIVKELEVQTYNTTKPKTEPTITKTSSNKPVTSQNRINTRIIGGVAHTIHTMPTSAPTVLKINKLKKGKDEDENDENKNNNEIREQKIKNVTTAMNLKSGPPITNKINPQEKDNNEIDDLPDLQID